MEKEIALSSRVFPPPGDLEDVGSGSHAAQKTFTASSFGASSCSTGLSAAHALDRPIANSYWVRTNRLLAGEYPRNWDDASSRPKLRRLLEAGVTCFIDLTEEGEYGLKPYLPLLCAEATAGVRSLVHWRIPIADGATPSTATMVRLLDTLDGVLAVGHAVYVHCWGGIGRTGTVIGCYLVRHGVSGDLALAEIARLRSGTSDDWKDSPETPDQMRMVLSWQSGI